MFYDPAKTYDDNFDNGPFAVSDSDQPYANIQPPKYKFLDRPINLPFGIAAGALLNSNYVKYAFDRGFDVLVYKTQRSVVFPCNPFPNIVYVDVDGDLTLEKAAQPLVGHTTTTKPITQLSITNSFAVPSRGPDYWIDDLKTAVSYAGPGQILIASVVGTIQPGFLPDDYYNDFAATAAMAASAGPAAIEVNLSCPNVATEGVICYTYDAVVQICQRVHTAVDNIPIIIKIGYFTPDQQNLLQDIIRGTAPYITGVAAINTISAAIVDQNGDQALPGPNRLRSGVCGASIKWAGLDMVRRLKDIRSALNLDFKIIGVGGVITPADYYQYLAAGADLVQCCTGAMYNPHLAAEIKQS